MDRQPLVFAQVLAISMGFKPRYHSLDDFLAANPLTIDGTSQDGAFAPFPIKGREIEAAVLFADITSFSERSANLDPAESLAFVNQFFTWISAEALDGTRGIVDKYIGDELMIVYSQEFGSDDPLADAMLAARRIGSNDRFSFCPHVGVAFGKVIVGYVGTPVKFNCSVFGSTVVLASRCASQDVDELVNRDSDDDVTLFSSSILIPEEDWRKLDVDRAFRENLSRRGMTELREWEEGPTLTVEMKNVGDVDVVPILRKSLDVMSGYSAEQHAREGVAAARTRRAHK